MHVSELRESKYLKKEECGEGIVVTIAEIIQQNVAKEGAPEELKWIMYFEELEKPMVLNSTNGQIISHLTGSEDSDGWIGHQIELYHDPFIQFAGKAVGGIRVRGVGQKSAPVRKTIPIKTHGPLGKLISRPVQGARAVQPRPASPRVPVDEDPSPFDQ